MSTQDSPSEIDFNHLKQYVGDDVALTKEVFGMFKHQVEMWARGLDPAADDEIWASVMHSLKGSARAVGAMGLGDLCERGEVMVGENIHLAVRTALVQDVRFSIDRVTIEIDRWEYRQSLASLRS
ncbi:MAG: Hpt domain-containing protein [Rhodobacteraceae bacterium]|nr:Hpt domain-containing protein [Paracoccaceae bacterium]